VLRFPCACRLATVELRSGLTLGRLAVISDVEDDVSSDGLTLRFRFAPRVALLLSVTFHADAAMSSESSESLHTASCVLAGPSASSLGPLVLSSLKVLGSLVPYHIARPGWHQLNSALQFAPPVERVAYEASTGRAATALSARAKRAGAEKQPSSPAGSASSLAPLLPPQLGGALLQVAGGSSSASSDMVPTDANVVESTTGAGSSQSSSSVPTAIRNEFEGAVGDGISSAAEGMKVVLLRPQWAHYRPNSGRRVLDVGVDASAPISGFSMLVRHSEKHGKGSQVKTVRVSAVTTDARGRPVAAKTLCTRAVPLVRPGTELLFDFARCRGAHVFVFEFLTCYGTRFGGATGDIAPPRVALFVRPT
jgi:hypothetical protein